jgi:hypothetical protein
VQPYSYKWWLLSLGEFGSAKSLLFAHDRTPYESWETLPRWGTMRGGELFPLPTPARLTCARGSGYLPTPGANEDSYRLNGNSQQSKSLGAMARREALGMTAHWPTPQAHKTTESGRIVNADGTPWDGIRKPHSARTGRQITTALADAVKMFPTPRAEDSQCCGAHRGNPDTLTSFTKKWPTPKASAAGPDLAKLARSATGVSLQTAVELERRWATPSATDGTRGGTMTEKMTGQSLTQQVNTGTRYATPHARDFRTGQQERYENPDRSKNLNDQIGGQLNPTWVEWLMGWPLGWTGCGASEMDRCRRLCVWRGRFWRGRERESNRQ